MEGHLQEGAEEGAASRSSEDVEDEDGIFRMILSMFDVSWGLF